MSEALRKLAEQLRVEVTERTVIKNAKCAQVLCAASGLALLQKKLGGSNVR